MCNNERERDLGILQILESFRKGNLTHCEISVFFFNLHGGKVGNLCHRKLFFIILFDTSDFSIQKIMASIKLTGH